MTKSKKMAIIAMVAAVYSAISLVLAPITYGPIQCRIAESLNLLPLIYAPSAYGVILGCFLTNLIGVMMGTDVMVIDIFLGTLATAIAVWGVLKFKDIKFKNIPYLSVLMPVIANGVIVGAELAYFFYLDNFLLGFVICAIEVAIGEMLAMVVGLILNPLLANSKIFEK